MLVASFGNAVAADYAAFVSENSQGKAVVVDAQRIAHQVEPYHGSPSTDHYLRAAPNVAGEPDRVVSLVLFVNAHLSARDRRELESLLGIARQGQARFIGIISTFRLHLDDASVAESENYVVSRASSFFARVVIFRPGHVLSTHSVVGRFVRRFASLYPLMPKRLSSCVIDGTEFFRVVETVRLEEERHTGSDDRWRSGVTAERPHVAGRAVGKKDRAYTILGPNLPWRDVLFQHRVSGFGQSLTTAVSVLLSWLLVSQLTALVLAVVSRRSAWTRQWHVQTLKPRSMRELLSLCHRHNIGHVKVVGYNNGVVHFGHRHPGKTVVTTIRCHRIVHAGRNTIKADCGATVRNALDFLSGYDQELYVVPNYSYVCLGTAFFVPIHGSAVNFSTVADTISRVVLYDPDTDRMISAARGDLDFIENVYNLQSRVVVLRLYLRAKAKSRYFVHREALDGPTTGELLSALRDSRATNVEIRQANAASAKVTVAKYYNDLGETSAPALELPRDALGRLWDRLEENPITSYLMHALSRHVAWHTELFFTPVEFALFWRTHGELPLRKIQLRYIRRDGMPHSPFRDDDCVSADLFLFRRHRASFLDYLKNTFPTVRTNPGKHSS